MADTTPNLNLPFILPSQAQKHVTHNEALLAIDSLVHLTIADEVTAPPALPAEGASYLVAPSASPAWADRVGMIATWQDGAWNFLTPREGWHAWFTSVGTMKVYSTGGWRDTFPASAGFDLLGVRATPDETNRLAVSSNASLFNHDGQGHQIKINKSTSGDTASLLFQSNWTGFAEMGLAGNNAFSIKVSDGNTWKTALAVNEDGHTTRPYQPAMRAYRSGTTSSPSNGQRSGFTGFALNQGGFSLGAALNGGGNPVIVPADGVYLVCLSVKIASSSGHGAILMANLSQELLVLSGQAASTGTQSASGIFALAAGDTLSLHHTGSATMQIGEGNTHLSAALL